MKQSIFPIAVLLVLFGGCASLPLPKGYQDSLLVMACEIADFKGEKWIAKKVEVIFRNTETGQEYRINLSSKQEYLTTALPSGGYILERVLLSSAEKGGSEEIREEILFSVVFFLEKNVVYFVQYTLHLERGEGGFSLRTSRNLSNEKAKGIYEKLKKKPFWVAWERAPFVGLDELE